jgi:hypothetical protein
MQTGMVNSGKPPGFKPEPVLKCWIGNQSTENNYNFQGSYPNQGVRVQGVQPGFQGVQQGGQGIPGYQGVQGNSQPFQSYQTKTSTGSVGSTGSNGPLPSSKNVQTSGNTNNQQGLVPANFPNSVPPGGYHSGFRD